MASRPSDDPSLIVSITATRSVSPSVSSSAVANAPCESMQKKQSFAADVAVASISRSARLMRGAREVVDQHLVGEAAQVDAEAGAQPHRHRDPRDLGQAAHDRLFHRALQALLVACHPQLLLSSGSDGSAQVCRTIRSDPRTSLEVGRAVR